MDTQTPELHYLVTVANRNGLMAVIDGQRVAIFTPVRKQLDEGVEHITFRVDRVQTVAEVWAVVGGGMQAAPAFGVR